MHLTMMPGRRRMPGPLALGQYGHDLRLTQVSTIHSAGSRAISHGEQEPIGGTGNVLPDDLTAGLGELKRTIERHRSSPAMRRLQTIVSLP
jgi:hypothetical protein